MNMMKRESCNNKINLLVKKKTTYNKINIDKLPKTYYINSAENRRPRTCQKNIIYENETSNNLYKCFDIIITKSEELNKNMKEKLKNIYGQIENEKNMLKEKEEKIFSRNKDKGNLPIIIGKRYHSRNNEIKTLNKKNREILEKLYPKTQKINKTRNNSYHEKSYNHLGIRYKDRLNYLFDNYVEIKANNNFIDKGNKINKIKVNNYLIGTKHIKIKKESNSNILNKLIKKYVHKNKKFVFIQNNCSICLEQFLEKDNIIYLPCLHLFHSYCIFKWLERKKYCPICKYCISLNP